MPGHLIPPFLPFICSVGSWSQCRLLRPPALCLASACFLALLYQFMLFPSSPEDCCSRCLYSQFSTGLILLLGPEHQALQLMLNSCLGWSSAGEKTQALIAGAALTSCRQGLEHSRPILASASSPSVNAPSHHTAVERLSGSPSHPGFDWTTGGMTADLQRESSTPSCPAALVAGYLHPGWRGSLAIAVSDIVQSSCDV